MDSNIEQLNSKPSGVVFDPEYVSDLIDSLRIVDSAQIFNIDEPVRLLRNRNPPTKLHAITWRAMTKRLIQRYKYT